MQAASQQVRNFPELSGDEQGQGEVDEAEIEAYLAAQYAEAEALAAFQNAQRTLRQAREAQADSRLNRGFYRGGRTANPGRGDGRGTGKQFSAGPRRPMGTQLRGRHEVQPPSTGQTKCMQC